MREIVPLRWKNESRTATFGLLFFLLLLLLFFDLQPAASYHSHNPVPQRRPVLSVFPDCDSASCFNFASLR